MIDKKVLEAAARCGLIPRRTITQVKTFSTNWAYGLETSINEWLADQPPDFRLIDIKYTCDGSAGKTTHSAMAIYTIQEPLEDDEEEEPEDERE